MSKPKVYNVLLIILSVIGAFAVLSVFGMWLMNITMTGGMSCCNGISAYWRFLVLIVALPVIAAVLFIRHKLIQTKRRHRPREDVNVLSMTNHALDEKTQQ